MSKTRTWIAKTVRVLPAIEQLVREIATREVDYRFLTEAEALEAATHLGVLVLAVQVCSRGAVLEAISREEVLGRLRLERASVWALMQTHGAKPAMIGLPAGPLPGASGNDPAPSMSTPVPASTPIASEAASILSSFGGAFLSDDD